MAALNCKVYTQRAVASIATQRPSTLILIDNGSTDGTGEWAMGPTGPERMAGGPDRLLYHREETNLGVAASWNLGIDMAFRIGARYVFVMNNDVVLAPDTLDTLIGWKEEGLALPSVHTPAIEVDRLSEYPRYHRTILPVDFCGFMVDMELINKIGWFDEHFKVAYWEDFDYEHRAIRARVSRGTCMDALAIHHSSTTIKKSGIDYPKSQFDANLQYLRTKWGGRVPDRYLPS